MNEAGQKTHTLHDLLAGITPLNVDVAITGLALDSRKVRPGYAFLAIAGSRQHGIEHIEQALDNGAAVIIYEPEENIQQWLAEAGQTPLIAVENLARQVGVIAARFYADPSAALQVIGITGTNGKTSCSQFLGQILPGCGIIGTLGWGAWGELRQTLNTTPDALSIQEMLAEFVRLGRTAVAMEVSSHGLAQGRAAGIRFKGAVYTNISRDHLDYHGSMAAYVETKLTLLHTPGLEFAVINLDDAFSGQMLAAVPAGVRLWGYSLQGNALHDAETVSVSGIRHMPRGIAFTVQWRGQRQTVTMPLFGDFNVENVLAVLTTLLALDVDLSDALQAVQRLQPVPGRMQCLESAQEKLLVFVDYAHTPDALEKVLRSLHKHPKHALWLVFGCGGDRDTGKRALMGGIAERWADHVVVTDDNPRSEDGGKIIQDILAGCRGDGIEVIRDREAAIRTVIGNAQSDDWIVIAGKGHEDYQEIAGRRILFSDCLVAADALQAREGRR